MAEPPPIETEICELRLFASWAGRDERRWETLIGSSLTNSVLGPGTVIKVDMTTGGNPALVLKFESDSEGRERRFDAGDLSKFFGTRDYRQVLTVPAYLGERQLSVDKVAKEIVEEEENRRRKERIQSRRDEEQRKAEEKLQLAKERREAAERKHREEQQRSAALDAEFRERKQSLRESIFQTVAERWGETPTGFQRELRHLQLPELAQLQLSFEEPHGEVPDGEHPLAACVREYELFNMQCDAWHLAKASSLARKAKAPDLAVWFTDNKLVTLSHARPDAMSAVLTSRGAALKDLGDLQGGLSCAREAQQESPHSWHPWALAGSILLKLGDRDKAGDCLEKASTLGWGQNDERAGERVIQSLNREERSEAAELLYRKDPNKYGWILEYLEKRGRLSRGTSRDRLHYE